MLLLAIWFVAWVRTAFSLEGLRLALGIHSPSKVYTEFGRRSMRHFWAGWDRAEAEGQWKKRHRLERMRARRQRVAEHIRLEAEILKISREAYHELRVLRACTQDPKAQDHAIRVAVTETVRRAYRLGAERPWDR